MRALTMTDKYNIKRLREKKELSYREIMRETGHSFRTVKKYADETDWNKESVGAADMDPSRYPVLGPVKPLIDAILEEDRHVPKKQRHTAKRIFDVLCEQHGFEGSYSTIKKYVRERKQEMGTQTDAGYLPLAQIPGTAQVDFGEISYLDTQEVQHKAYLLVMTFPYSNKGYAQVLPAQNQECFLEGLKGFFEHIGGVPTAIRLDNLSPAVSKVLVGREREMTDGFARFAAHYNFEPQFCAPAAGNEKGSVENKVGYIRRNRFSGLIHIDSFAETNRQLLEWCEHDAQRIHYSKGKPINTLWEEDERELLRLPEVPLEIFRYESMILNKYGWATFETNRYGLDPGLNGAVVQAKIWYDRLEFFHDHQLIGTYSRVYGRRQESLNPAVYLKALTAKPNAVAETRFFEAFPEGWKTVLADSRGQDRRNALKLLRDMAAVSSLDTCEEALQMAADNNCRDLDSIRHCFEIITRRELYPEPLETNFSIPAAIPVNTQLQHYDRLSGGRPNV